MKLYDLVFQQQNRYKFWSWGEVFSFCNLNPSEAKQIIDSKDYQLQDPLSALVFSHKNHEQRALDNIFDNYTNLKHFELGYNDYGLSTNFILHAQSPTWQNYNVNTDWYWKQNWIYKYGQLLLIFPGVRDIYLSCSAALENSHDGSDIDLMIKVNRNFVWITKTYFAILSKILKYYNLNFGLAAFYLLTGKISKLETLKCYNVKDKIKIDFGLVFESQSQLEKYYKNKERNIFIWSGLKLENSFSQEIQQIKDISNPPDEIFRVVEPSKSLTLQAHDDNYFLKDIFLLSKSIQTKRQINYLAFKAFQILLYPTLIVTAPFGVLNFLYEQKHRNNINKLVLWNIYSQYNLVY